MLNVASARSWAGGRGVDHAAGGANLTQLQVEQLAIDQLRRL